MAKALIKLPTTAKRGEIIEIKTLILHPMETGFRPGANGQILPRDIIQRFSCLYNGVEVFAAELHPATASNPYIAFSTVAQESGTITLRWTGDNGFDQTETVTLTVL